MTRPDKPWEKSLRELFYAVGDSLVDIIKIWTPHKHKGPRQ